MDEHEASRLRAIPPDRFQNNTNKMTGSNLGSELYATNQRAKSIARKGGIRAVH